MMLLYIQLPYMEQGTAISRAGGDEVKVVSLDEGIGRKMAWKGEYSAITEYI